MPSPGIPAPARILLAALTVSFAAVLLREGFGVVSPVWPAAWDNAYYATELLAVAICGLRAWHAAGHEPAAWAALTVGLLCFAGGDLYWAAALSELESPPFPSLSDAGYLTIYPAAYVALVLLLRARAGRVSVGLWLDGLIAAFGVAALGAALVFDVVATTEGPLSTVATNLAYPLGDLALLAFVMAVVTVAGCRAGMTWLLIALGFMMFAVADSIYLYQTALGTYREHTLLDAGWPASFLLIAFAAWQPARRLDPRRLRRAAMLAVPATLALTSLGILIVDHFHRLNLLALSLASASIGLIVARFALTFRENLRMLRASEQEATTDPLTELGNRRALVRDLDLAAADGAPHVLALFDLDGFKGYNDAFGHAAGDALLARLGRNLTSALDGRGSAYRMGGDEFCVLAPAGGAEGRALVARAAVALGERGERFRITSSFGMVQLPAEGTDAIDALRLADQRMYAHKRGGRRSSEESIHQVLLRVVGEHDGALLHHLDDVARLAEAVGRELGLTDAALIELRRAAALHDIGKVAIPDAILNAPRALEPQEWEYMRQHTVIGARIIGAAPALSGVAEIVRSSHERFDGDGYPDGLAGEDIPLGARIVAVCDAYDAMITTRAYRAALTSEQALAELERCAGTQFDARVVAVFAAAARAAERLQAAA